MPKRIILPDEIVVKFNSGGTVRSLSREYRVSQGCIKRNLEDKGIKDFRTPKGAKLTQLPQEAYLEYERGASYEDIKNKYKVSYTTVKKLLTQNGIKTRSFWEQCQKYTLNKNYFDIIDAEQKAYWLGFLYADGCNYHAAGLLSINLAEKDKGHLELLKNHIGSNYPLKRIENKGFKDYPVSICYGLCIYSRYLTDKLTKVGCHPNKTFSVEFPTQNQVPKSLIRHFIRGYLDGDGCISVYKTKKAKYFKSVSINICGNKPFLIEMSNILTDELKIKMPLYKTRGIFELRTSSRGNIDKLLEWIYKDATVYLDRKYQKFIQAREEYKKAQKHYAKSGYV